MTTIAKKTTFLTSLGAGLEYYDFIIYGMMAGILSPLFFGPDEEWMGLIKTFGVFAVGYLMRPIGGIVFGMIGDTYGRKKTFLAVMFLMAISTFCIGLLPTYSQIGNAAGVLLVLLRILQGLSFGAELPGAITVVCESSQKQKHGSYAGIVISSVSVGSMLASFVLFLLSQNVNQAQIHSWGWRIPFLLGGLLALANYYIRKHLQETPEFTRLQSERKLTAFKEPLLCLVRQYRIEMLLGIGMTSFVASLVIFALYLPTYLTQYYSFSTSDIYLAMTWGMLWSACVLPICGWLADFVGKVRMFIGTCLVFMLGGAALFAILAQEGLAILVAFMILYQTVIACVTVCYFPLLAALFPTAVRYTGLAACYNITYSLMATAPILITALIKWSNSAKSGILFLLLFAIISAISCYLLSRKLNTQSILAQPQGSAGAAAD